VQVCVVVDKRQAERQHNTDPAKLPRGRPVALPSIPVSPRYGIADLERETGFNARTIRYYIAEGMLTPAHGRGPSATYDKDHLLRLRFIRELKEQFLPLETIKAQLTALSTNDLEAHFAIEPPPSEDTWRRIVFNADLELHVRRRERRDYQFERAIEQIVQYAKYVLDNYEDVR
jgi:DNA-binding transcriptional MerR regulator